MLGSITFLSDLLMEALPNIHLVGVLTVIYTIVFKFKALIPTYVYVFLTGFFYGFNLWWVPYLYIWRPLWGMAMLVPRRLPPRVAAVVYPIICALHGICYGTLYAPAQALMMGLDFKATVAWIISGLSFDVIHAVGNLVLGVMAYPLALLLRQLMYKTRYYRTRRV